MPPLEEVVREKRTLISPVEEPQRIWLILGCQVTVVSAAEGKMECVSSERRVAAERIWRFPVASPQRMFSPLGEKIRFASGCSGVLKFSRTITGVLNFRVSHTIHHQQSNRVSSTGNSHFTNPSFPLVTHNLASLDHANPPVHSPPLCASLTSITGLEYGPPPA